MASAAGCDATKAHLFGALEGLKQELAANEDLSYEEYESVDESEYTSQEEDDDDDEDDEVEGEGNDNKTAKSKRLQGAVAKDSGAVVDDEDASEDDEDDEGSDGSDEESYENSENGIEQKQPIDFAEELYDENYR